MLTTVKKALTGQNQSLQETIPWERPPQDPPAVQGEPAAIEGAQMTQMNLRLQRREKQTIKKSADLAGKTVTDYMLDILVPDRNRVDKSGSSK